MAWAAPYLANYSIVFGCGYCNLLLLLLPTMISFYSLDLVRCTSPPPLLWTKNPPSFLLGLKMSLACPDKGTFLYMLLPVVAVVPLPK